MRKAKKIQRRRASPTVPVADGQIRQELNSVFHVPGVNVFPAKPTAETLFPRLYTAP